MVRSSPTANPLLVTVFGGGGFIGRYVVEMLLKSGARVRVAQRNPKAAFFLQPLGGMSQLDIVRADVTNPASVAAAVDRADAVINLVAIMGGRMEAVNAVGAGHVASAAHAAGAATLVHVSAIGADPHGASFYSRSKGHGEARVRAAFPDATLIRPSLVFGPEDQLTNRFAGLLLAEGWERRAVKVLEEVESRMKRLDRQQRAADLSDRGRRDVASEFDAVRA